MNKLFSTPQTLSHPRYVSHRGFQPMAPANSLPSFEYAGYLRQWAIETDVHFTATAWRYAATTTRWTQPLTARAPSAKWTGRS